MMDTIIGQVIDNYKILEVLGRGGMGVVFKAIDLNLEKIVALKMIDPYLARDENFLKRFKTEAKALAKLEDKNIVSVYALRENPYGLFMVMEYVKARTLSEWLNEKGKFTNKETVTISSQVIHAINCAHKSGVIHRDIKPNNVLLCDDGTVKVMDFGLAKVIQEQGAQQTVTQFAAGTLHYMSPEQIKGLSNVDKRSDIYSIGVTIYEMLAGRTPFNKTDSEFEIQKQIVTGKITSPLKYNPEISPQLVKIIMKAVEKDFNKRYQSLDEMLADLNKVNLEDGRIVSEADEKTKVITPVITKDKENTDKRKRNLILAGSLIIILAALAVFLFNRVNSAEKVIPDNNILNDTRSNTNTGSNKKTVTYNYSKLSITSSPPGASVIIDNKQFGKTPLSMDSLNPKTYSISMKMEGYETWTDPGYTLSAGDNPLYVKLQPVSSIPSATAALTLKMDMPVDIYIDNVRQAANTTEYIKSGLETGSHKIRFEHPEFGSKETTVKLSQNQKKELVLYYVHKVSIQSLNSNEEPFWGSIYINNKIVGETPFNTTLKPGRHEITVTKSGYTTREKVVTLDIKPLFESKTHFLVFHLE